MGLLKRLGLRISALDIKKTLSETLAEALAGPVAPAAAPADSTAKFEIDLSKVRRMATLVPGPLPTAINGLRFAASVRPRRLVIEGGDETLVTMPRTVYQLVYPDGTIMLDAGMDKRTHDSFSPDKPEPYHAECRVTLPKNPPCRSRRQYIIPTGGCLTDW